MKPPLSFPLGGRRHSLVLTGTNRELFRWFQAGLQDYPPPAAPTAVPVGHLWNASKGWRGGKKSSCPDAVFQASLAMSVTATPGELPTPQFRAEIVANAQVCSNRGPQAIVMRENRLARCKLAFPITGPRIFTPSETNLPPVCKATGETCRLVRTFSGS